MNFLLIVKNYLNFGSQLKNAFYGSPFFERIARENVYDLYWIAKNRKFNEKITNDFYHFWRGYFHMQITNNENSYYGFYIRKYGVVKNDHMSYGILSFICKCLDELLIPDISEEFINGLIKFECKGMLKCGFNVPANVIVYINEAIECDNTNYLDKCKYDRLKTVVPLYCTVNTEKMAKYLISRGITEFKSNNIEISIKYNKIKEYVENHTGSYNKIKEFASRLKTPSINNEELYNKIYKNLNINEIIYLVKCLNVEK